MSRFNPKEFIGRDYTEVEEYFIRNKEYCNVFHNGRFVKSFGRNEGGKTYEVFIDHDGTVVNVSSHHFGY